MRQSTLDLPDPLNQRDRDTHPDNLPAPDPAPGLQNADDLLAQLAGQEVDRLIAEARTDQSSASDPEPPPALDLPTRAPPPPARQKAPRAAKAPKPGNNQPAPRAAPPKLPSDVNDIVLDDLFKQLGDPAPAASDPDPAGPPPAPGADLEQSLTARAQELIDQARIEADLDVAPPAPHETAAHRATFAAAASTSPRTAQPQPDQPTAAEPPSNAAALAAEMEEDARVHAGAVAKLASARDSSQAANDAGTVSTLNVTGVAVIGELEITSNSQPAPAPALAAQPIEPPAPITFNEEPTAQVNDDPDEDREPLLLRLLEWLNAPLSSLSDSARTALGKAAIATTVNALAILLYVLLFRRG